MKTEQEIIDFLENAVGLDIKDEIPELFFPFDNKAWAQLYLKSGVSACAIFASAYLRELGLTDPELMKPYQKQIGMAVSNVVAVGRRHNALVSKSDLLAYPNPGDIVVIGTNGNEHVLCCVSSEASTGLLISSDSGQASANTMAIRHRMMVLYNGLAYLVDPVTPYKNNTPNGRVISFRLDINKINL